MTLFQRNQKRLSPARETAAFIKISGKTLAAVFVGILGALLLGVGMCRCLLDPAKMVVGIVVGVVGIVVLLMLIALLKCIRD